MVKFETLLIVSEASETWFNSNISTEKKNETNEKRERERDDTRSEPRSNYCRHPRPPSFRPQSESYTLAT